MATYPHQGSAPYASYEGAEGQRVPADNAALYGFLQAIKKAMQTSQATTQCNQL